ncbi:MAG: cadherin-like beta sandwich domain-containing protein, partial [Spirochaetaceae bacterium]|nr:cadherin-like beta sandwich domain-containing protein [Spirochaetaceae bacterium]
MKAPFVKSMMYAVVIAFLAAGGFLACQMDEVAAIHPPTKRGGDNSITQPIPYLDSLAVDGELDLSPLFSPTVLTYEVDLPKPPPLSVTITAAAADGFVITYKPSQSFTPSPLSPAQIVVTNAAGKSTFYIIVFNADEEPRPPARLSDIKLSQGQIDGFDPDIDAYEVEVPYGTGEVVVVPEGAQEGSLFTFNPAVTVTPLAGQTTRVTIGVVAPNYSLGTYTVDITAGPSTVSQLLDVTLSAGNLEPDFAPGVLSYDINITETVNLLVVDAVRISAVNDTVSFAQYPSGALIAEESATASFDSVLLGGLNDKQFTITVHQGLGFTPTTYTFKIVTNELPPARLSALSFTGGTLWQGQPDNLGIEGFSPDSTTYTLTFTDGTNAAMTAEGQDGAAALYHVTGSEQEGHSITVNYNPLRASQMIEGSAAAVRHFVTIAAHKDEHIDTTYTVFFKKTPLPQAALQSLSVYGGTLLKSDAVTPVTDADVRDTGDFVGGTKQYTINTMANTQAVIVEGTPPENSLNVAYTPKNFTNNIQYGQSQEISVTVSDGDLDYASSTYILTLNVLEEQIPRLTALSINVETITLADSILVYAHSIQHEDYPAGGKPPVAWSVNGCVSTVSYSFDSGSSWHDDADKNGFAPTTDFMVNYSETKPLLVKLHAEDGAEAVYTIILTQTGSPDANLTNLKIYNTESGGSALNNIIKQRTNPGLGFASDVYAYDVRVPYGTTTVYVEPDAAAGSAITYSIDGAPYAPYGGRIPVTGYTIFDVQTLNIRVQAQGGGAPNIYTLYIKEHASNAALLTDVTIAGDLISEPPFTEGTLHYEVALPYDFTGDVIFSNLAISNGAALYSAITAPGAPPVFTLLGASEDISDLTIPVSGVTGDTPKILNVKVTAQNTVTSNVYSFYITKAKNNQALITNLAGQGFTFTNGPFTSGTNNYNGTAAASGGEVSIEDVESSPNAVMQYTVLTDNVVTVPQDRLISGESISFGTINVNQTKIAIITVVSEDGSQTNSYTFSITNPGSLAAQLLTMSIAGGTLSPGFTPATHNYTVTVPLAENSATIRELSISAGASLSAQIEGQPVADITVRSDGAISDNIVVSG